MFRCKWEWANNMSVMLMPHGVVIGSVGGEEENEPLHFIPNPPGLKPVLVKDDLDALGLEWHPAEGSADAKPWDPRDTLARVRLLQLLALEADVASAAGNRGFKLEEYDCAMAFLDDIGAPHSSGPLTEKLSLVGRISAVTERRGEGSGGE